MSEDLEAGAAPAESGEAAPVEAAAVEAAPIETEESSPVESAEPADLSLTAEDEAVEDAPVSFPSHEEFGWDDWDGSADALPEQLRGWGSQFGTYYHKKMDTMASDMDQTREIYDALMGGHEDPRIEKMQGDLTSWQDKHAHSEGQLEYLQKEFNEYQQIVEEAIKQEANEYADEFASTNQDLFENEKLSEPFAELLEEGWILEHAAVAARLPQHLRDIARQAKSDGVPDTYALKLAQGAKSKPAKPRPGAAITSGATTPVRSSEQVSLPSNKPMSLRDFRTQVARNALSNKRR
tara:strand:+ start:653 stop:1534 length:882 start_codon:yes stop_codon:yes gene_type:complete